MKSIIAGILALVLSACESIPITAAYTGHVAGHEATVGYSTKGGIAVAVSQK